MLDAHAQEWERGALGIFVICHFNASDVRDFRQIRLYQERGFDRANS